MKQLPAVQTAKLFPGLSHWSFLRHLHNSLNLWRSIIRTEGCTGPRAPHATLHYRTRIGVVIQWSMWVLPRTGWKPNDFIDSISELESNPELLFFEKEGHSRIPISSQELWGGSFLPWSSEFSIYTKSSSRYRIYLIRCVLNIVQRPWWCVTTSVPRPLQSSTDSKILPLFVEAFLSFVHLFTHSFIQSINQFIHTIHSFIRAIVR